MSDYPTRPCTPTTEIMPAPQPPACENNRWQDEWRQEPIPCLPRQICPQPDAIYIVPLPYPQPYRYPTYPSYPGAAYEQSHQNYPGCGPRAYGNFPDYSQTYWHGYPRHHHRHQAQWNSYGSSQWNAYDPPQWNSYGNRQWNAYGPSQWNSYGAGYPYGNSSGLSQFMQLLPMLNGVMGGGGRHGGNNPMNMLRMFMPQMPF